MKRKHKGILLLALGILGLTAGLSVLFAGISSFVQNFKSVATVESPGSVPVTIEEAGLYTVWHDHRTTHRGTTVNHNAELPTGFTFTLMREFDQKEFPLDFASSHSTLSTPNREAVAVGTFSPDLPGAYTLQVVPGGGEHRIFSLTQGSFLSGFARFAVHLVLTFLISLAGLVLLIIGIVLLATKPRIASA